MRREKKVLACVDKSDYAAHVADYAAWAAARLSAPIELLHVIDRLPEIAADVDRSCLLYTSPSPRDRTRSRMPSSA